MKFTIISKYGQHSPHNILLDDKGEPESVHIRVHTKDGSADVGTWRVLYKGQFEMIIE